MMAGTLQSSRIGIPPAIKMKQNTENNSYETYWRKNDKVNSSSYVMGASKIKKNVLLLSAVELLLAITDDKKKASSSFQIIQLYQRTDGHSGSKNGFLYHKFQV